MQEEFDVAYRQLNTAQKRAVDTIEGPVMVIAGPGTGKTHLLALRTANILQKTDTAPQNILCLTYTEVGARNLRDRIKQTIGMAGYDVRISTYHGFGSDIFRSNSDFFIEFGNQQPVDRLGQDRILQKIFEKLPVSNPLWNAEVYLKDSLETIMDAKNALLTPDDIILMAEQNSSFIDAISGITTKLLQPLVRMDKKAIPLFESLLLAFKPYLSETVQANQFQPLANLAASSLNEALQSVAASGKTNALTIWKNNWLVKNTNNDWVLAGKRDANKLLGFAEIFAQYNTALQELQLYDFSDMIQRAIHALVTHDDLRFSLQEQYQYVMLDEFQDTNLAQLKLVELLTNNPESHGMPNVLAVGDDDQAIFSFQGADLTNMVRFTKLYKQVEIITLTDNYRSQTNIVSASNAIANQIEERLSEVIGKEAKELKATQKPAKHAHIERQHYKSEVAQYSLIAQQIVEQIAAGTKPQDIAVIAPRHRYLEPLIPFIRKYDIPVRYEKRENVFEDSHIAQILLMSNLILALSEGNQHEADSMWPAILSAPFWDISTSNIWHISWQARQSKSHWLPLLLEEDEFRPIALFFVRLSLVASEETLENMLDYIVGVQSVALNESDIKEYTSPYFEYYFGNHKRSEEPESFTHILSNLTVLRQHLREHQSSSDSSLKLSDLIVFANEYENAGEKLLNTNPYHGSENAVQILTAYGSKGLEFDTVYILGVVDEVWGMTARTRHNNIVLPPNMVLIRRAGSTKDERKRLFYVAITRAKQRLILASYAQNFAGKPTSALEFMLESDDTSPLLPEAFQSITSNDSEAVLEEDLRTFWTSRHINEALTQPTLRELLQPQLDTFQLSATHLNSFTNLIYGGPEQVLLNSILRFPKAPSASGQFGSAIHETLEYVQINVRKQKSLPSQKSIETFFTNKLQHKQLSNTEYERQLQRGIDTLRVFIPEWGHNFVPEALPEQNFVHEGAFVGEAHLTGKLDQILVDADSSAIKVIDFKTGGSHSRWTRDVRMHNYKQQLLFYKLLIENSHSYRHFSVEEGSLVFVEANDDGIIQELPITYTAADVERTSQLIQAVWKRIMSLDLPDVSAFSKDMQGITMFEDWLIEHTDI